MRIGNPHSASAFVPSSATSESMLRALYQERGEELFWQGQHKGSGCLFTSFFCLGPPPCVTSLHTHGFCYSKFKLGNCGSSDIPPLTQQQPQADKDHRHV